LASRTPLCTGSTLPPSIATQPAIRRQAGSPRALSRERFRRGARSHIETACVDVEAGSANIPFMPPLPIEAQLGSVLAAQASPRVMTHRILRKIARMGILLHQCDPQTASLLRIFRLRHMGAR